MNLDLKVLKAPITMNLNEAPNDIIYEIFKKLDYSTSIKFLGANRKIYLVSCKAKTMIDDKLFQETMRETKNNIREALLLAITYNNINVVHRLYTNDIKLTYYYLQKGMRAAIDNKNEAMGQLLISKINNKLDEWDLNMLCTYLIENKQLKLIQYILEFYPSYCDQSIIIYLIKHGYLISTIIKQLPNLKHISRETILILLITYQDLSDVDLEEQMGDINTVSLKRFIESNEHIAKDLLKRYGASGSRLKIERNENALSIVMQLLKTRGYKFNELNVDRKTLLTNELEHLTVAELKVLADREGFTGLSKYRKDELVEMMTEIYYHRSVLETLTPFKLRRMAEILYIPRYIEMSAEELIEQIRQSINN